MSPLIGSMLERKATEDATIDLTGLIAPPRTEAPREQAVRILTEIVAEVGEDYRYKVPVGGCHYADVLVGDELDDPDRYTAPRVGDKEWQWVRPVQVVGSCIVGRLIEKIDPASLDYVARECNDVGYTTVSRLLPSAWTEDEGLMLALLLAQVWQDDGSPYGQVLRGVQAILERHGADLPDWDIYSYEIAEVAPSW